MYLMGFRQGNALLENPLHVLKVRLASISFISSVVFLILLRTKGSRDDRPTVEEVFQIVIVEYSGVSDPGILGMI